MGDSEFNSAAVPKAGHSLSAPDRQRFLAWLVGISAVVILAAVGIWLSGNVEPEAKSEKTKAAEKADQPAPGPLAREALPAGCSRSGRQQNSKVIR